VKPSDVTESVSQREQDERWMRHAMALAARAEGIGEIPVGAVLVLGDKIVAEGWNRSISEHDACAHAGDGDPGSRRSAAKLSSARHHPLCDAGALLHVRRRPHPQPGQAGGLWCPGFEDRRGGSVFEILQDPRHNHQVALTEVLADACSAQLSDFFKRRRAEKRPPDCAAKEALPENGEAARPSRLFSLSYCQTGWQCFASEYQLNPFKMRSLPLLM
jgi:tRNA(adenine34) deaminase